MWKGAPVRMIALCLGIADGKHTYDFEYTLADAH